MVTYPALTLKLIIQNSHNRQNNSKSLTLETVLNHHWFLFLQSLSVSIQRNADLFLTHLCVTASPVYLARLRGWLRHSKSLHNLPVHPRTTQLSVLKHYADF